MRAIDLHSHSNCSDGTLSVKELMDLAHKKNLAAIALTDHDTVDGLDEAISYTKENYPDLELVPGIEISTAEGKKEVHVVGLFIDHHNETFRGKLKQFVDSRINRNIKMCDKLREEAGIPITFEELAAENPGAVITRAHFARFMTEKGLVNSWNEVFEKYIGDHCPYFVDRVKIAPEEAIEYILDAGGVPVLAHPILYHFSDRVLEAMVKRLKEAGLVGIEAIYSTYSPSEERQIKELAAKYDLLISGGSDFHGANKPKIDLGTGMGKLFLPEDYLEPIRRRAQHM